MEVESAFVFNADFESFMSKGIKDYKYQSSSENTQFEYLILCLEQTPLYSQKKYSTDYLEYLQNIFNKKISVTNKAKKLIPWWGSLNTQAHLCSKLFSARINKEFFNYNDIDIIFQSQRLSFQKYSSQLLYIDPNNLSGRGHLRYPRDKTKILSTKELIIEPMRDRFFDMSALFLNAEPIIYENIVSTNYHYRGSFLYELKGRWVHDYKNNLTLIHRLYKEQGIEYPFSVDSYLYKKDGKECCKSLSEINARKSMGWVAYKLKQFFKNRYCAFVIMTKELRGYKNSIRLSPDDRKFYTYYLGFEDEKDLLGFRDWYKKEGSV